MASVFTSSGNDSGLTILEINENIGSGRIVYQARAAHDDGSTAAISYSLTDDPTFKLSINSVTGDVFLNEDLDFESNWNRFLWSS